MVGILTEDNYLYLIKRGCVECIENKRSGRVNLLPVPNLLMYSFGNLLEIRLVELFLKNILPGFLYPDLHYLLFKYEIQNFRDVFHIVE